MLLHKLSSHKGRLLLSVLMLKDANPDHYAVPGVECVVSHESLQFADDGHEAFLGHLCHLLRVTHALEAPHCNVHSFSLPPYQRGRDRSAPPQVDQRVQCEGLEALAQLPRTPFWRSSPFGDSRKLDFHFTEFSEVRIQRILGSSYPGSYIAPPRYPCNPPSRRPVRPRTARACNTDG